MRVRVRRFSVVKTANTVAVIYGIVLGIAFGLFALLALLFASTTRFGNNGSLIGVGVGAVVGLAILWLVYTLIGWVFAAISCLVYNGASRFTGGIEFDLTQTPPPMWGQMGPAWGAPPGWSPPPQPGPSWGAYPPPQGPAWTPPPGPSWGPGPGTPGPGPSWPMPPQPPGSSGPG